MPRKKSVETTPNSEATPAVVTKKPTKKAATTTKAIETTPPKASKRKRVDLGPPLDPASLEGANEHAESILGKTLGFTSQFSTGTSSSFGFRFKGKAKATDKVSWWWRQCGAAVVFESEPMKSRYIGRIVGNTCSGTALNPSGVTWTWQGEFMDKRWPSDLFQRE
jgi:hypothetical protein